MALETYTFTAVDLSNPASTNSFLPSVSIALEIDIEAPITNVIIGAANSNPPPTTGIVYPLFR